MCNVMACHQSTRNVNDTSDYGGVNIPRHFVIWMPHQTILRDMVHVIWRFDMTYHHMESPSCVNHRLINETMTDNAIWHVIMSCRHIIQFSVMAWVPFVNRPTRLPFVHRKCASTIRHWIVHNVLCVNTLAFPVLCTGGGWLHGEVFRCNMNHFRYTFVWGLALWITNSSFIVSIDWSMEEGAPWPCEPLIHHSVEQLCPLSALRNSFIVLL